MWHPGEGKAYIHQFGGDGAYGFGTIEPVGDGKVQLIQDFYNTDGTRMRSRHDSTHGPGKWVHDTSYNPGDDGSWEERRSYDWKLMPSRE